MKTKLLRRLRREGRCQIRVYSVRKDMDGTVVGIRYGYNSDEYAHLWHFAMTSDELKSEAMKIYILRRIAELKRKEENEKSNVQRSLRLDARRGHAAEPRQTRQPPRARRDRRKRR